MSNAIKRKLGKYNIRVLIFREGSPVILDWARREKGEIYKLLDEKTEIPSPKSMGYVNFSKGLGTFIILNSPVKGTYYYTRMPRLVYDSVGNLITAEYEVKKGKVEVIEEGVVKSGTVENASINMNPKNDNIKAFVSLELLDHDAKNWLIESFKRIESRNKKELTGMNAFMQKYGAFIGFILVIVGLTIAYTQFIIPMLKLMSTGITVTCQTGVNSTATVI